jgi:hypothetical protein
MLVTVQNKRFDPLQLNAEMPLAATYYPAGFPLHVTTNSRHVIEAAAESWSCWSREFDVEPLRLRVVIEPAGELAGPPTFRLHSHMVSVVSDAHNFAAADTRRLIASIHLSEQTAADHAAMRWFYVESIAYLLLAQRYLVAVHAGCVARGGAGLLLCGASEAGKSTLAFACARAGWTYVCDDCTWLLAGSADRTAIGKPHQVRFRHDVARHFPELAGHIARTRPNGKLSIELPTSLFPEIATASRCPIAGVVFLDRASGGPVRAESIASDEAVDTLLSDMPSYGEDVDAIHEETIGALRGLPAWRLHYQSLEQALRLLSEIQPE